MSSSRRSLDCRPFPTVVAGRLRRRGVGEAHFRDTRDSARSTASGFRRAGLRPAGKPDAGQTPDHKKVLPPSVPEGTFGGRTFAEPITLPSTDLVDFRLPATVPGIDFVLPASRTRRRRETRGSRGQIQGLSGVKKREVLALCKLFFFPHFHSYLYNLWITRSG